MWAKFPTNIHLFCSFCFAGVFSSKKVCFDIIQVIIWMACFSHVYYVYFSFCSQYDVYIFVVIRLGRGLFCAYSRSHMAQFKHTLWSNKHCVYNCVPHYLLHRSGNSEAYFFIYVYETASYVLWIRNMRSTVELWLHDQNETLRLCVNKMICWKHFTTNYMKVKNLSGKLIHRWRWYRWCLWTGECKWQQWGRKWSWCDRRGTRNWTNWRERRQYGKHHERKNIKWIQNFYNNSREAKVQNSWWCSNNWV